MSGWGLGGFGRPQVFCALRAGSPVEMLTEPGWKNQHKVSSLEFVAAARKLGVTSTSLGHSAPSCHKLFRGFYCVGMPRDHLQSFIDLTANLRRLGLWRLEARDLRHQSGKQALPQPILRAASPRRSGSCWQSRATLRACNSRGVKPVCGASPSSSSSI